MYTLRSPSRAGRLWTDLALGLTVCVVLFYALVRWQAGDGGVCELGADEVAVQLDHGRGTSQVLTEPGTHVFVPWLQEVHRFSRRPFEYRLEGNDPVAPGRGPRLLVRARDGASYAIDRVIVQAALDPARAPLVLRDSGTGEHAEKLVDAFVRSGLGQAFGAFTTEEILAPDARELAVQAARAALEERLGRHGMVLLELEVSGPAFSDKVSETIGRRQVAEQDTERLLAQADELLRDTPALLAELERHKELELTQLRSKGIANLAATKLAAQRAIDEATGKAAARIQSGDLLRVERLTEAERLEAQHRAEASALADRVGRLQEWGPLAVRAALIEKLGGVRVDLQPADTKEDA